LTTTFMPPWRYSSTSRERCRAIGLKPIDSSTWPSACGAGGVLDELDAFDAERIAGSTIASRRASVTVMR
jgi:hypothetical protein